MGALIMIGYVYLVLLNEITKILRMFDNLTGDIVVLVTTIKGNC